MDFSKSVIPAHLLGDRGSNLVVINPGSANVRIGLAQQDAPFSIPHCIARHTTGANQSPKRNVQDQNLNSQVTTAQHVEREKAYDIIASLLKIPFLDEEVVNNSYPRKMGRVDVLSQQNSKKESMLAWTDVFQKSSSSSLASESPSHKHETSESPDLQEGGSTEKPQTSESKYREYICGEEAMRISPTEPYCLRRPIRRGHLNISQHYSTQQVLEDLQAIWDWILVEKLHIPHSERNMYSALIVVPETFDNREIKEILSIVLRDLRFSSAVVHQEGLAAVFGNGLSTACVVNIGAQVTSVICVEVDGVALPHTQITLRFGGEDVSRCLLWTQRHHQTWPPIRTDALAKPIDLLMLNRLKESYCQIYEGEVEAVGVVHSYEDGLPPGSHKTRLTALNVAPMGLFYPTLLVPDVYPPPPRSWFKDYEDMLEDTWHIDFPRRTDISDGLYPGISNPLQMWDNYSYPSNQQKKEDNIGLAEAITKSILSTVALTTGLISAMEERVLHAIPSNEAIDTVEVLQSRTNPSFVAWRGGAILGVIDYGRDAWIHREDWIQNGIHIAGGRKYKDSYYLQAQPMCYINS
ncbi:Actin-related protein [Cynara cardunculus var. scolymus]|uniref:Actin-related protein 9 n=1 Tax=Cynara cardunculus var. scolymus TaxID=59895 RepID=A0A103XII1_CYNCS|nr:Actin-related protein [Cynara cardunculus var. scolymus]